MTFRATRVERLEGRSGRGRVTVIEAAYGESEAQAWKRLYGTEPMPTTGLTIVVHRLADHPADER